MKLVRFFILRPVGTTLLTIAMFLAGILGYTQLPVSELPKMTFPIIMVSAQQPGGSPSEIASTIAAPLERHLGAIAGIRELTSTSTINQARILLQFDLSRSITGAAQDVEAAIRAARQDLPTSLRTNPRYVEANTDGAPIMVLTLTSPTRTPQQLYDYASNVIVPGLSQVEGVGSVDLHGSALPAVRVEINPLRLFSYGIGFEDLRAALASANAHTPKGFLDLADQRYMLATNDQAEEASAYRDLIVAYRNSQPVRLTDVADVINGAEDLRQAGYVNGKPDIICLVFAKSDANVIKTSNQIKARLPQLREALPSDTDFSIQLDDSLTIRASLSDTQRTLILAIVLVVLVVMIFLLNPSSTLVPAIVVPVSIVSTFAVMALLGYQLDILSLMALTIATGFVVDDAIVVLENITRFMEMGHPPEEAAILGAGEVAFTVFSITLSLIVVFLPILLMDGIGGMFFHEFAMTLVIALSVSLVLSLTLTPMLCAQLLRPETLDDTGNLPSTGKAGWKARLTRWAAWLERQQHRLTDAYSRSLDIALRYRRWLVMSIPITIAIAIALFMVLPKELFPQEDEGMLMGRLVTDPDISFHALQELTRRVEIRIAKDPNIVSVIGGVGGRSTNSVNLFITLKPLKERTAPVSVTIEHLNHLYRNTPGVSLRLRLPSMIGGGARSADGLYQYTLQGSSAEELAQWAPRVVTALSKLPILQDVNSDMEKNGRGVTLVLNRDLEARYLITPQLVSNVIYDAFSQRSASIIYKPLNQYRVIMEAAPRYWRSPTFLQQMWVSVAGGTPAGGTASNNIRVRLPDQTSDKLSESQLSYRNAMANALAGGASASNGAAVTTSAETMVPLLQTGNLVPSATPLSVNHQGEFVAVTISFNLAPKAALSDAMKAVNDTMVSLGLPHDIQGGFAGSAADYDKTAGREPLLILAALVAVYIVLGILYESLIHPLTILSTLPSAGVGALLAVFLFGQTFSLMTLIGIILLIGIVKKNAIMLVDFAIIDERHGASAEEAIKKASHLRFRPILMTTLAAALGALPLLLSKGYGYELRRPLGVAILGGLCLSQLLTLYTTPAVYLTLDRLAASMRRRTRQLRAALPF
ncbi:efflux RND transporter permease subunit [Oecophyllibacter saccharovorans]|uniref:Nodulation protein n=1 Tax=Oecophyllibacter saccharovorans TaxID=2558360 RepID=A0A506URI4_9PROT|nr:efflux RND transporter permease subunit [Oecophyllibacter saccharovorans]TPW35922.1 nodulation protein [Oecophyllibacter saccharovorans]